MTEEPPDEAAVPRRVPEENRPAASTELVLPERRAAVPAPRRAAHLIGELRDRLPELRRHPAVVASASAAATVGSALLVNGLRHALQRSEVARPGGTDSAVVGYILHEVHVIHHLGHDPRRPLR